MRPIREVTAVSVETGEKRVYATLYQAAKGLGTSAQNVMQAISRGGACCGWKLYDSPATIKANIAELQNLLKEVEAL